MSEAHFVILVGVEGSGKTTIGKMLATNLGYEYLVELGGELRQKSPCQVDTKCELFDELLMYRELERDNLLVNKRILGFVLEQWHIGNIAFSLTRASRVAENYLEKVKEKKIQLQNCTIIDLVLPVKKMIEINQLRGKNIHKPEAIIAFYEQWLENLKFILGNLGLKSYPIDACLTVEEVYNKALEIVNLRR
ncbi:MAG: hypothetical protein Q8L69_03375 [Gallionellaceae bacterium]|nr:hypothetical protein [Gallionellaceae bacterium]